MNPQTTLAAKTWTTLKNLFNKDRARQRRARRNSLRRFSARRLAIETLDQRQLLAADQLFIGDGGNNTVQQFDAQTAAYIRNAIPVGAAIHGPRGILLSGNHLLVVNQNTMTDFNGEVLSFNRNSGATETSPVPSSHSQAPFAPRGMVLKDNILYVADAEGNHPRIVKYNFTTGNYVGELAPAGFTDSFQPRGLVFGPDGGLYVSSFNAETFDSADPAGYIFRFDVTHGSYRVVSRNNGDGQVQAGEQSALHNPEGIVFGPDGRIYVTSNTTYDNTTILVVDPTSGQVLESQRLSTDNPFEQVNAETIVFGPGGQLFVPVLVKSTNAWTGQQFSAGGVWKYDPASKQFDRTFIPHDYSAPVLTEPWYISFGQTDPATLAYVPAQPSTVAPVLSNIESNSLSLTRGSRQFVSRTIRVTDTDSQTLTRAEVKVTVNYQPQSDRLVFRNRGNIRGSWNAQTGTLTLTGIDTLEKYQAALRSVLFQSSNMTAGPRTVSFTVRDATQASQAASRQVGLVAQEKVCNQTAFGSAIQFPTNRPHRIKAVLGNHVIENPQMNFLGSSAELVGKSRRSLK